MLTRSLALHNGPTYHGLLSSSGGIGACTMGTLAGHQILRPGAEHTSQSQANLPRAKQLAAGPSGAGAQATLACSAAVHMLTLFEALNGMRLSE